MPCAELDRLQAYCDGELDATAAQAVTDHLTDCTACRAACAALDEARAMVKGMPPMQTPAALRARIDRALDAEDRARGRAGRSQPGAGWRLPGFWWGGLSGVAATLVAGVVAFWALALPLANPLVDDLVTAHVGSLESGHPIEVVSTDRHTVKPWFAGRVDVSPAVADFDAKGYPLVGGRIDTIGAQRAAVVVYRHGPHLINVFCWPAPRWPLPMAATRRGYHVIFWKTGDLAYAAVADTGWDELQALEHLLETLAASDRPAGAQAARE